jgi:hypothetical protein
MSTRVLAADHPASFRRFFATGFSIVPVAAFHGLDGEAADADAECARTALLREAKPLVIMGMAKTIGILDPPVCDFHEARTCARWNWTTLRMRGPRGAFARFETFRRAPSLTVPFFCACRAAGLHNGEHKSAAVRAVLRPGDGGLPASALRAILGDPVSRPGGRFAVLGVEGGSGTLSYRRGSRASAIRYIPVCGHRLTQTIGDVQPAHRAHHLQQLQPCHHAGEVAPSA